MAGIEEAQRFPFVNLEKAMERAKQLYEGDQRGGDMAVPTAFDLWDYSVKSSGGNQTISALKSYGLISDSGASEGRRIRLTKEALQYFRDERESERERLLRIFATSPPLLAVLFKDWGATPPSDTVARSHLKVDRGLAEQSARSLLNIYKDNLAFAKFKGGDTMPELGGSDEKPDDRPKAKVGDYVRWSKAPFDQADRPHRVTWVSDDVQFVRIHGNPTGIPMSEVSITEAPTLERERPPRDNQQRAPAPQDVGQSAEDITVLLVGGRLQITADVDKAGIAKLKNVLAKYEEILGLLS